MAATCQSLSIAIFFTFFALTPYVDAAKDEFYEELLVKPLESGHLYTHFQFTTEWGVSSENDRDFHHYHLFPKSLGEVLAKYKVQELHLTQTAGLWKHEKWGYPVKDAGPGAELWVWFLPGTRNIDTIWTDLINVLSGMFCASLNFMDKKNTAIPKLSFKPEGVITNQYDRRHGSNVRYASLPSEMVCTENLTPWKKLLPCGSKTGLASLFNAGKLYDASYHSLGIHYRPICKDSPCNETAVELSQTLAAVFEPGLNSPGTQDWSFKKIFGKQRMLSSTCAVASSSKVYVDLSNNRSTDYFFNLTPPPTTVNQVKRGSTKLKYAEYDLKEYFKDNNVLVIEAKYNTQKPVGKVLPPVLHSHRFQTGYGQEKGGINTLIYNTHPSKQLTISYFELVPWYLRSYLHTLKVEAFDDEPAFAGINGTKLKPLHMHYVPGKDRQRPHQLELVVTLPASSVTRISWQFQRALLKWTEYPPDANHGFYVSSAVISALVPTTRNYTAPPQTSAKLSSSLTDTTTSFFLRLHTETLLVTLPTPDFSMPYNVICLACTVVAIAFGSLHNLTTRRFVVYDPSKKKGLLTKLKEKFLRRKPEEKEQEKKDEPVKTVNEEEAKENTCITNEDKKSQ